MLLQDYILLLVTASMKGSSRYFIFDVKDKAYLSFS